MRELSLLLLLVTTPAVAAEPATWAPQPDHAPWWEAHGTLLRVDGAHLLHVESGTWHTLTDAYRSRGQVSPDGTRVARASVSDHQPALHLLDLKSGQETRLAVRSPHPELTDLAPLWVDDGRLLLLHRTGLFELTCTLVDSETGTGLPLASGCPESSFYGLYDVTTGPEGRMVVYSAGEGHPGVDFVTWTPETQAPLAAPPLDLSVDLYPYGPLGAGFDAEGTLYLQTPCDLSKARGCNQDVTAPEVGRVYRWTGTSDPRFEIVFDGLPPGVVFDPWTKRLAWTQDGQVCHTDRVGGEARCVPTPPKPSK